MNDDNDTIYKKQNCIKRKKAAVKIIKKREAMRGKKD